ncbi:MAG: HDOD domain-containing protein [Magnetococcales bacterium]|nr:HDOD domain-containing protein [Magnetococcales bacterium]
MATGKDKAESRRLKRAERLLEDLAMPSRPDVLLEAVRAQSGFAPDPAAITEVILKDMALAAAVLRVANTCLTGWKRKVISIEGAVALLGMERVRAIVAEQFLSAALVGQEGPLQAVRLLGVESGLAAARLARALPAESPSCRGGRLAVVAPDEAYAIGLLHDCGMVAMLRGFPDYAGFCREMRAKGVADPIREENDRFGTNHCLAGYLLARAWRLPSAVCRVIRSHHRVEELVRPGSGLGAMDRLVTLAMLLLCAPSCGAAPGEWPPVDARIAGFFGMSATRLAELRAGNGKS